MNDTRYKSRVVVTYALQNIPVQILIHSCSNSNPVQILILIQIQNIPVEVLIHLREMPLDSTLGMQSSQKQQRTQFSTGS